MNCCSDEITFYFPWCAADNVILPTHGCSKRGKGSRSFYLRKEFYFLYTGEKVKYLWWYEKLTTMSSMDAWIKLSLLLYPLCTSYHTVVWVQPISVVIEIMQNHVPLHYRKTYKFIQNANIPGDFLVRQPTAQHQ